MQKRFFCKRCVNDIICILIIKVKWKSFPLTQLSIQKYPIYLRNKQHQKISILDVSITKDEGGIPTLIYH